MRRKPSEALIERLRAAGLALPADARLEPTYASAANRRNGAWVWELRGARGTRSDDFLDVGSVWRVRDLLAGDLEISQDGFGFWHVDPLRADQPGGQDSMVSRK